MSTVEIITITISIAAVLVSLVGTLYQRRALQQKDSELRHKFQADADEKMRLEMEFRSNLTLELGKLDLEVKKFHAQQSTPEGRILEFAKALEPADDSADIAEAGLGFPYNDSVPIRQADRFFGRRDLLSQVLDSTRQEMKCMALLGIRKSGKTSFLRYVEDSFTVEGFPHIIPVYLDAQSAPACPNVFYSQIVRKTSAALYARTKVGMQMPDFPKEIDFPFLESFLQTVCEQNYHFLFLLDEFENLVVEEKGFDGRFFGSLRSLILIGHGQVSWITASFRPVNTPHTNTSPFENILSTRYIGPLLPEDARQLVAVPARRFNRPFSDPDVEFILKKAGRLPFPLQKASLLLYQTRLTNLPEAQIHVHVGNEFAEQMRSHYDYQYGELSPEERAALLQVYAGKSEEADLKTLQTLESYGFIERGDGEDHVLGEALLDYLFHILKKQGN
jgi:hypothetical protein